MYEELDQLTSESFFVMSRPIQRINYRMLNSISVLRNWILFVLKTKVSDATRKITSDIFVIRFVIASSSSCQAIFSYLICRWNIIGCLFLTNDEEAENITFKISEHTLCIMTGSSPSYVYRVRWNKIIEIRLNMAEYSPDKKLLCHFARISQYWQYVLKERRNSIKSQL